MKKVTLSDKTFAIGMPALVWQGLFFYLPLFLILVSSFIKLSETGAFEGLTLSHITTFFTPTYAKVLLASFVLAFANAILCLALAYPLAYYLAFIAKRMQHVLLFLLIVPFWTNFLLHVYAWFYVLERHGMINTLLLNLHLIKEPIGFLNSPFAIMIMMVYYYLPFMVLPLYSAMERFNHSLIEASYDLGAGWFSTVKKILLPLTKRGIIAGFFLVFIPSFGEFAIPELMGGDKYVFVGTVVSQFTLGEGTGSLGSAFTLISALALIAVATVLYKGLNRLFEKRRSHA